MNSDSLALIDFGFVFLPLLIRIETQLARLEISVCDFMLTMTLLPQPWRVWRSRMSLPIEW